MKSRSSSFSVFEHIFPWLFFAAMTAVSANWLASSRPLMNEHSGRTLMDVWRMWDWMQNGGSMPINAYPPLCSFLNCLGFYIDGGHFSAHTAVLSQLAFMLPLGYAVYILGRQMGGIWGGIMSLEACLGCFWLHFYARGLFLEVGESCFAVSAAAAYFSSKGLRRPIPSLVLGLSLGLGMLTKWACLFYVLPLLLHAVFVMISSPGRKQESDGTPQAEVVINGEVLRLAGSTPQNIPETSEDSTEDAEPGEIAPAAGLAVTVLAALMICGWWYAFACGSLLGKGARDLVQGITFAECFRSLLLFWAESWWLLPIWFMAGGIFCWIQGGRRLDIYFLTAVITMGAAAIYAVMHVPGIARYMLPSSILCLSVAFSWLGQYRGINAAAAAVILAMSLMQIGVLPAAGPLADASFRLTAETMPSRDSLQMADKLSEKIKNEMQKSGEQRMTAVSFDKIPGLDADTLIIRCLEKYSMPIDIDIYVPVNYEFTPQSSLLLQMGGTPEDVAGNKHFTGYKRIAAWKTASGTRIMLYKNSRRRDTRPDIRKAPPE